MDIGGATTPADSVSSSTAAAAAVPAALFAGLAIPHSVCSLVIFARLWSRLVLLHKWFLDDTLIMLAWACATGLLVVYAVAAGTPTVMVADMAAAADDDTRPAYILRAYAGLILDQLALCLTKLSVLALYRRMFSGKKRHEQLVAAAAAFVLLSGLPLLAMAVLQCHPAPGVFFGRPLRCFGFAALLVASSSLHMVTDASLIILIVPTVLRLELPPRQKAALGAILSLGVFAIAASLLRLQLSLRRGYTPTSADPTSAVAFFIMTLLECDIAIICASASALRPLLSCLIQSAPDARHRRHRHSHRPRSVLRRESIELTSFTAPYPRPRSRPQSRVCRGESISKPGASVHSTVDFARGGDAARPLPFRDDTSEPERPAATQRPRTSVSASAGHTGAPFVFQVPQRAESFPASEYDCFFYQQPRPLTNTNSSIQAPHKVSLDSRWHDSQESFVLGRNDPLNPKRLSPISDVSGDLDRASIQGIVGNMHGVVGNTQSDPPPKARLGVGPNSRRRG